MIAFVKAPRPGEVKTRLAGELGPEAAAELYRQLAEAALLHTAPQGGEYERVVCFAPREARDEVARWLPGEALEPQRGDDLGSRMTLAFLGAFERGARRVALMGTDVVGIDRALVLEAFAALEAHDLALGPARDGGYYLIALERLEPRLFEGITWSTPTVLAETMERAAACGLRVRLLRVLRDVDTIEDVRAEGRRAG